MYEISYQTSSISLTVEDIDDVTASIEIFY